MPPSTTSRHEAAVARQARQRQLRAGTGPHNNIEMGVITKTTIRWVFRQNSLSAKSQTCRRYKGNVLPCLTWDQGTMNTLLTVTQSDFQWLKVVMYNKPFVSWQRTISHNKMKMYFQFIDPWFILINYFVLFPFIELVSEYCRRIYPFSINLLTALISIFL